MNKKKTFEDWWQKCTFKSLHADHTSKMIEEASMEGIAREAWNTAMQEVQAELDKLRSAFAESIEARSKGL